MDTIKEGRFEDTNKMFEQPNKTDIKITKFLSDEEIENLANLDELKMFDWKKPTVQMLGRWQP